MGFTEDLAHWVATAPRRKDSAVLDAAERAVADTVACMMAGSHEPAVLRVGQGLAGWGSDGACSVVGRAGRLDAPWAALHNGTAAHALDFDDVLDPAASHISAVLVPALLALGEECDASGFDLLDAYIQGVEVQECLAEAVNMVHCTRGWHTTLTLGAPSAAAACARLLGLGADETRHAMSLATSMSGGFKRQFGTNAKPFHAGLAAKNGLIAARMAAAGLTADPAAFEGERGFFDLMAGPGAAGFTAVLQRLAGAPAVLKPGLWLKRYPCCASTHRPVDALLWLMQVHAVCADDIVSVEALVSAAAVGNLMYDKPLDAMQAKFSMPYCLASAALDGDLRLGSFEPQALQRPAVQALMPRMRMVSDPLQPADMPSTTKSWAVVTLTTAGGVRFTEKVVDPLGYPDKPLSEDDLQRKFADCSRSSAVRFPDAYPAWRHMASQARVRSVCAHLRPESLSA